MEYTNEQTIQAAQLAVSTWAERTFEHTEVGIARHLVEEAIEVLMATGVSQDEAKCYVEEAFNRASKIESRSIEEESADVFILLLTLAGYVHFDLDAALRQKHMINLRRNWAKGETGLTHHLI